MEKLHGEVAERTDEEGTRDEAKAVCAWGMASDAIASVAARDPRHSRYARA